MADGADYLVLDVADHAGPVDHLGHGPVTYTEKLVGAVDEQGHDIIGQGAHRVVEGEGVLAGYSPDNVEFAPVANGAERHDGPVGYGAAAVRDDGVYVDIHHGAKSLAMRAVALRGVERERVRRRLLEGNPALGIHQMAGIVVQAPALRVQHGERAFPKGEGGLHGSPDAPVIPVLGFELVHHKFDEVRLVAVEGVRFLEGDYLPVDAYLGVTLLAHLLEELLVASLAPADQW